jgi:ribosomal protein S18 acetylase RimI-like enzyme
MHNLFIVIPLLLLLVIFFIYSSRLKTYFNYRVAHNHELPVLQELGIASYSEYEKVLEPQHWQTFKNNLQNRETWTSLLASSTPFVCENNNTIVGMAFLVPRGNDNDIYPADTSCIRLLAVHPAYTGKGIARKLTAMCIDEARNTGEKTVMLHTSEFMDAARHIYESLGFKIVKEIPPRFGKRYWLYKLDL